MMRTSPACDLPDETDLEQLLSCLSETTDKRAVGDGVSPKLSAAFAGLLLGGEEVFGEKLFDLYDFDIEWYGVPFIRVVMFPKRGWFDDENAKNASPSIRRYSPNHPMDIAPTLSLGIQPPIERHVNGPWPAHYVLELEQPNTRYGVLMADLWRDWRRIFTTLCARLDVAMSGGGRPLSTLLDSSQSLECRLAACFSDLPLIPEELSDSHDYSAHLEFGFPFGKDFESAQHAFNLMYPILSSALGYGINCKDRMFIYMNKLGLLYNTNLPQLSNYLHEHPILKKTYFRRNIRRRAGRKQRKPTP